MKNAFYSMLKSSFCSQDIHVFIMTFCLCRKNGLIRKIRLISKFMTSQLVKKQLQYTYCAISREVKATNWSITI